MKSGISLAAALLAGAGLTASLAGCSQTVRASSDMLPTAAPPPGLSAPPPSRASASPAEPAQPGSIRAAAQKLSPAVVNIHTQEMARVRQVPLLDDPILRRFFGSPGPSAGSSEPEERVVRKGAGSGVIISQDGYILTNSHVIADADRVQVDIDGKGFDARVIGKDSVSDLAVVKVDTRGARLPVAELGNSDAIRVGDWAIAVGNPLDVGTSVTLGIISAVNRKLNSEGHPLQSLIQTDAAINPGNSGGALADIDGRVVGINEAIATTNGGSVGIGFAIPINAARKIADELIRNGRVIRPYLGIGYVPLKALGPAARQKAGIQATGDDGVVVGEVYAGGPAARAGLKEGDVILEANRQRLTEATSLNDLLQSLRPGDSMTLLVLRNGRTQPVTVTLRERPQQDPRSEP
jgi:S1-C subfamily serine protease